MKDETLVTQKYMVIYAYKALAKAGGSDPILYGMAYSKNTKAKDIMEIARQAIKKLANSRLLGIWTTEWRNPKDEYTLHFYDDALPEDKRTRPVGDFARFNRALENAPEESKPRIKAKLTPPETKPTPDAKPKPWHPYTVTYAPKKEQLQ